MKKILDDNQIISLAKRKKTLTLVVNILSWIVFGIIVLAVLSVLIQTISGQTPNLFGYRYYYVLTSSMSPELEPGDVILSKLYNPEKDSPKIEIGDTITFIIPEGNPNEGALNTHKVITPPYLDEVKGEYYVVTKGVNNLIQDAPTPVTNIQAVMVKKSLPMSKLYRVFLGSNTVLIVLFVIPFALIIGSLIYRLVVTIKKKPSSNIASAGEDEEFKKKVIEDFLNKSKEISIKPLEAEKKSEREDLTDNNNDSK